MVSLCRPCLRLATRLVVICSLAACAFPAVDLAPPYQAPHYVVPVSWQGSSPFVEATPSDQVLRPDWWKEFRDPTLDSLEEQAMAANPDLQAAAERFVQARDVMMKARAQYLPHIGLEIGASGNKQSIDALFRPPNISEFGTTVYGGGWPHGSRISGPRCAMPHVWRPIVHRNGPPTLAWHVQPAGRGGQFLPCGPTMPRARSMRNRLNCTASR